MSSPTLSPAAQSKARRALLKSYPFLKRVKADVQPAPNDCFVMRFQLRTDLKDGTTLRQQVRATVNGNGDVLKVVSSR
jgi:transcription termination factor Rho